MYGPMTRSVLAIAACVLVCGCFAQQDRAASHAEKGQAHLTAGRPTEALIDFHSALKLDPQNPDYARDIAEILIAQGEYASARFYLGEAYRLDPQREATAVTLAVLLFENDPEQADTLLAELIERNPESAWGHIGRSEQALFQSNLTAAERAAERALELDPELADGYWHRARVEIARIREQLLTNQRTNLALYERALVYLEYFAELDPVRSWMEITERARLLAAWPGREDDAEATLREASKKLDALELPAREYEILNVAIKLARRTNRPDIERWALERKVEISPRNYVAWDALADLQERIGESGDRVYQQLIEKAPGEPEPHIRRARHIQRTKGSADALAYLRQEIPEEARGPEVAAEAVRQLVNEGDVQRAFFAVGLLADWYPDSHEAVLMNAWRLSASGNPRQAIGLLSDYAWTRDDPAALRILTDVHLRLRDSGSALAVLDRTLELMPEPDPHSLRMRASLLHDLGRCEEALRAFARLSQVVALGPKDLSSLADCYIQTDGRAVGIRLLETLVELPDPPWRAVVRLSEVGRGSPEKNQRIRSGFVKLLLKGETSRDLLERLVVFEIAAGTPEHARLPLTMAFRYTLRRKLPQGRLHLLLAMVEHAEGNRDAARELVLGILTREPRLPGALEFAGSLYPTREEALAAIQTITEGGKKRDLPAASHALLGRLYYRAGNTVMARWSYEQALTGGLELPILKNDLAFLLATQKRDLERARLLAQQASEALPNEPGVIDTLGYVLLELRDYEQAAREFRRADVIAIQRGLPRASIQYHLGLALNAVSRATEAERAFAISLELDEDFPEEDSARRELASLRGEI